MAMQLASMVHGSGREHEVRDNRHLQQQHQQQQHQQHPHHQHAQQHPHQGHPQQQPYPQQHAVYYPQPPPQRGVYGPPPTGAPSPYPSAIQTAEYQYQRAPPSPPSPPVEEQKQTLPSISSLLTIADCERANSDTAGQSPRSQQHPSPQLRQEQHRAGAGAMHPSAPQHHLEGRPDQATHAFGPTIVSNPNNPKMTLPPTPPMHPDSVVDGNQSPSVASSHSATPYFLGHSMNNMEPHHHQRVNMSSAPTNKRHSIPSQASMSPYHPSPYQQPPYATSPGTASVGSYYSPEPHYNAGLYAQRQLPNNFEPQNMALPAPNASANASNVWQHQHHHYISASSQSAYPQSQDRYICSTCNKAFSRPSSLRIHSHSHTGEKPYKCPQPGCGKAFSVRSNMKRHERGCHAAASASNTTTS